MDKLNLHASHLDGITRVDDKQLRLIQKTVLFELAFNQSDCKRLRINRKRNTFKQIRNRTDMILMTVGNHNAADFIDILFNI